MSENNYRVQLQMMQMIDGEKVKVNFSLLPEQRDYLSALGDGNASEGYRIVLENALSLIAALPALDTIAETVMVHGTEEQVEVLTGVMTRIASMQVAGYAVE